MTCLFTTVYPPTILDFDHSHKNQQQLKQLIFKPTRSPSVYRPPSPVPPTTHGFPIPSRNHRIEMLPREGTFTIPHEPSSNGLQYIEIHITRWSTHLHPSSNSKAPQGQRRARSKEIYQGKENNFWYDTNDWGLNAMNSPNPSEVP